MFSLYCCYVVAVFGVCLSAANHFLFFFQPLGYKVEDSKLKRAGLDYWPYPMVRQLHEGSLLYALYAYQLPCRSSLNLENNSLSFSSSFANL